HAHNGPPPNPRTPPRVLVPPLLVVDVGQHGDLRKVAGSVIFGPRPWRVLLATTHASTAAGSRPLAPLLGWVLVGGHDCSCSPSPARSSLTLSVGSHAHARNPHQDRNTT